MIQKNYRLDAEQGKPCFTLLPPLEKLLENIQKSDAYRKASSVYVKLLLGKVSTDTAKKMVRTVSRLLPNAVIAGTSLTLFGEHAEEVFLTVNCCFFEHSTVTLLEHDGCPEHYKTAGRHFGQRIARMKHVKGVEIFCAGLNIDVSRFVTGVTEKNEDVPFFGALAGIFFDRHSHLGDSYQSIFNLETYVSYYIIGGKLYENGIVMIVFSGEDLHIKADYLLGWKPLGKELTVTRSVSKTCIATIDNIPATEIYKKYLNVQPDKNFLENICEFPLLVERNGCLLARVPPRYSRKGNIYFNADIDEGEKVRLSYANSLELLQETLEASNRMWEFHPEGIFLCICGNRTIFLKDNAPQEVEDYRRLQSNLAVTYGSGEIYRHEGKGGVLNSAFVAVGLREGSCPAGSPETAPKIRKVGQTGSVIPLSARLAAFLDATTNELKASNKELQDMAEAAKSASIAKSQFLSNMSHEIRTPINAILGMDEMILRECRDETILEYAENIRMAGNNLLGLINDILDFSKIESGKLDIIPVEYALSSVLNDLVNMSQGRAEKKGLHFDVVVSRDIPSILYGDEIRLKQIVTNILTNAVKYTEKGSVKLLVDYTPKASDSIQLRVSVKDTGIGIKEADIEKLFTAFERIEEKRNRSIEGTGLGMNITQRLLALMGSKLDVKSVYGKGSEFSFTLEQKVMNWEPMGDFEESYRRTIAHRKKYQEKFTAPTARVLVVDDTVMNITVVKGLLKQTLVQIDTAESGYECLHLVTKNKYDIIFLDHRMPGIDGIETLQRMKALAGNLNQETPVISLTANAVSGAREEYIAAGFRDYLTKPINSHQLEMMMIKYLPPEKLSSRQETEAPEDEEPDISLPAWLSEVEGLDTEEGIRHCGSAEDYLEALTVFAESVIPGAKEIARFYQEEDWKNYTTKVHALKSSSRVIGATELSERAKRLEDAGNSGYIDEIKSCSDDLLVLYLDYAEKLAPLMKQQTGDDTSKPPIEAGALAEAYEALGEIALSFDYDSLLFVLQSLEAYRLPEADAERYQHLKEAAAKPDWDAIAEILKI